jgi:hypothetical protein
MNRLFRSYGKMGAAGLFVLVTVWAVCIVLLVVDFVDGLSQKADHWIAFVIGPLALIGGCLLFADSQRTLRRQLRRSTYGHNL